MHIFGHPSFATIWYEDAVLFLIFVALIIVPLALVVRLVCASYSERIRGRIRRRPVVHAVWALLAVGAFYTVIHPYYDAHRKRVWRFTKFADWTNNPLTVSLTAPGGSVNDIILAVPLGDVPFTNHYQPLPFAFAGRIDVLRQGQKIHDFEFDSKTARRTAHLADQGFPVAFALNTRETYRDANGSSICTYWVVGDHVRRSKDFALRFTFTQPPPTNSSVWLSWRQLKSDYDKEVRTGKTPPNQPAAGQRP